MGESHTDKAKAKATDKPAAAGGTTLTPLKFVPFTSQIDLPFYAAFFASKLDHDKLSESARPVYGVYEAARPGTDPHDSGRMLIQGNALTSDEVALESVRADGIIKNSNTLEAFKSVDRKEALDNASRQIWDAIKDGTIYSVPSLLTHFVIISYADLKKYKMMYWFCYPALHSDPQWNQIGNVGHMTGPECNTLVDEVNTWKLGVDKRQRGFFLAKKVRRQPRASDESAATWSEEDRRNRFRWTIGSLDQFETGFFNDADEQDRFVSFVDPSSHPEAAGWPLRNLLVLVRQRFHLSQLQVLCYRDVHSLRHSARSIILRLGLDSVEAMEMSEMPKATGWERNQAGLLRPVAMSLRESMDPRHIAQQSVDLNVKLMKWRIAPGLNLDVIKNTKCLLLGAGTLGSYVSRNLMGWGVRKISFVDYGSVSFSNPVRQPLFNYKDCLDGGARKASRAADALKEIFPGVDSEGHVLSVPMLGHPVDKDSRAGFDKLKTLIDEHDAIFLLMDTRESRWLPTVMGKAAGKIVMNAALGFDSYVVLRHGLQPADGSDATLGCYFCNDVVAPGDSQKDLTLDQQCTTTRPGIAAIASAQLVELLISLLQHPLGGHAPAPVSRDASNGDYERDPPDHPLGIVPHQIRGFLGTFRNVIIKGESYPCCSACSKPIVSAYKADGWNFVKRALESKDYVSELSGLAEVQRKALAMEDDLEWDEDEDEDEEGDKGDQGDKEVDEEAVLL